MMLGLAAASSALDLIKSLTSSTSSSSKTTSKTGFSVDASSSSSSVSTSGSSGPASLLSPDTMNALFAAQSDSGATSAVKSPMDALKSLFGSLDADGSGGISKTEFENALGAGGTNTANADKVFGEMDANGDGSISLDEMASALKPKKAHGPKHGGGAGSGEDALMQMLDSANAAKTTNADGSVTSTMTLADGSTVTMTTPAASSSSTGATRAYSAIEQMFQKQVDMVTKSGTSASSSLSVSV